jgi:hypothetical protein
MFLFQKNKLIENSKSKIAEILSNGNSVAYQTYYRKLDKLTEDDCREIDNEQEFLNYIEKLDQ